MIILVIKGIVKTIKYKLKRLNVTSIYYTFTHVKRCSSVSLDLHLNDDDKIFASC